MVVTVGSKGQLVIPAEVRTALGILPGTRVPYADAFGVDLASDSPGHVLLTADFDVAPAKQDVRIEFLPAK
jgi:hypothetical protein